MYLYIYTHAYEHMFITQNNTKNNLKITLLFFVGFKSLNCIYIYAYIRMYVYIICTYIHITQKKSTPVSGSRCSSSLGSNR